jgi:N-acetylmuramoyl-L-alanine amidase
VDGKIRTDRTYLRIEETACLPLRDLRVLFGGRLDWRSASREVRYRLNGEEASFALDASSAVVAGQTVLLSHPVRYWGDDAYVPLTFLTEPAFTAFVGADIDWNESQKSLAVRRRADLASPQFQSDDRRAKLILPLGPRVRPRVLRDRPGEITVRLYGGRSTKNEQISVEGGAATGYAIVPRGHSTDLTLRLRDDVTAVITETKSPRALVIVAAADPNALTVDGEARPIPRARAARRRASPSGRTSVPLPAPTTPAVIGAPSPTPLAAETKTAEAKSAPAPLMALSPVRTIVIDPGHGGHDVGATGPRGTYEKDVNLRLALALAKRLRREGRYRVLLTREDDRFLPLQARSAFANEHKGDLFVSIHCNAALSAKSNGFEVYFLSEKASDETAASVARRENAVVELEDLADKAAFKLKDLLGSLAKAEHLNESSEIAALMDKAVSRRLDIANRGVRQAGFYVLRGAAMPAVLVESAFITHPKEEARLRTDKFAADLAEALHAAIRLYEDRQIQARLGRAETGRP